jgi:hypothetical protein
VIVLADGLSYRASQDMPFLNSLRRRGADFLCTVGLPSLSSPGRAALFSGASQEIHGQTTNFQVRPLAVDTLFKEAGRGGMGTGLAGGPSTQTLLGPAERTELLHEAPEAAGMDAFLATLEEAKRALSSLEAVPHLGLVFGELDIPDEAGHLFGARSAEYRAAAAATDDAVRALTSPLDLATDTILVTADHGHIPGGGHGGPEKDVLEVPLVLAGAGIRAGASGQARQIDVAPTVSALLGIPTPASNEGRILLEGLTLPAPEAALEALCVQRERFVSLYAQVLGEAGTRLPSCEGGADALLRALGSLESAQHDLKAAREARERGDRQARMWLVGGVVLGLGFLFLRVQDGKDPWGPALLGAGSAVGFLLLRPVLGIVSSLSAVNKDRNLGPFFARDMGLALGMCLLCLIATSRSQDLPDHARRAWILELFFILPLALRGAFTYVAIGALARWELPDPARGFGFYLDILALTGVALATPILPLLSWGIARLRPARLRRH